MQHDSRQSPDFIRLSKKNRSCIVPKIIMKSGICNVVPISHLFQTRRKNIINLKIKQTFNIYSGGKPIYKWCNLKCILQITINLNVKTVTNKLYIYSSNYILYWQPSPYLWQLTVRHRDIAANSCSEQGNNSCRKTSTNKSIKAIIWWIYIVYYKHIYKILQHMLQLKTDNCAPITLHTVSVVLWK